MKSKALEQFWGLLFLKQSDQTKYGHLLREFRQQYANKQKDIYPDDLAGMFEVMKTVQVNKKKKNRNQDRNGDKDKNLQGNVVQPGAESFAQQGKEIRCFCCGKEGELSTDCPLKSKIASKDWFNKTGIEHWKTTKVNTHVCQECPDGDGIATKDGFVGMQVATPERVEPEILLDLGSTISLFRDSTFLKDVWESQSRLIMETNAGKNYFQEGNSQRIW